MRLTVDISDNNLLRAIFSEEVPLEDEVVDVVTLIQPTMVLCEMDVADMIDDYFRLRGIAYKVADEGVDFSQCNLRGMIVTLEDTKTTGDANQEQEPRQR